MNRAVVDGLLTGLRGKARLVSNSAGDTKAARLGRSEVLEDDFVLLRVEEVGNDLAGEIKSRLQEISGTNKVKGIVLDLRFADGNDYGAAAAVVDLFVESERPLLDWGNGPVRSKAKADAIGLPVVALVNRETVGAPEVLAALLREVGTGLIIGNSTAGAGMMMREFPLKNGQRLQLAVAPVKFGDGKELSAQGVKPDIEVAVTLDAERAYREDAYATAVRASTSGRAGVTNTAARRPRPNEADLVRSRREGTDLEDLAVEREREPAKPVIRDPALSRAVDVLKGLAVVRRGR